MDRAGVEQWATEDPTMDDVLVSLSFEADRERAMRAAQAMGWCAAHRARADVDQVRDRIRRLLWSMNHESGSLVWMAPDIIGEMVANVPSLAPEYTRVLAAFINLPPFVEGVHRAVARIASVSPGSAGYLAPYLEHATRHPDAVRRLNAALALARIDATKAQATIERLGEDQAPVPFYDHATGRLREMTVSEALRSVLEPG